MKKFLIDITISVVFISAGFVLSVFELKDFQFANAPLYNEQVETFQTRVNKENPLRIESEKMIKIHYEIDEGMGEDVEIKLNESLVYGFSNNRFKVKGYHEYGIPFGKYVTVFLEGLKHQTFYYYAIDEYQENAKELTIRCSEDSKRYIEYHNKENNDYDDFY